MNAFEERYGSQNPDDTRWLWLQEPEIIYRGADFTAAVVQSEAQPMWYLVWTDHVANEWVEHYDLLAIAVLRLGALIDAVATDRMFSQVTEGEFAQRATEFLEGTSA